MKQLYKQNKMKYLKLSKEELETLYVALDNETKCFSDKLVCEDHKKDVYNILEQVIILKNPIIAGVDFSESLTQLNNL